MAWTDQCKFAFKTSAQALLGKQKKKNVNAVLKLLSEETDIPFKTLKRWWYEKESSPKNETTELSIENNCEYENNEDNSTAKELSTCLRCNINKVEINSVTGKPNSSTSKYYGLCSPCRKKQKAIEQLDNNADNGLMTICPHCTRAHFVSTERLEKIFEEYLNKRGIHVQNQTEQSVAE